jgi:hypothetical protein
MEASACGTTRHAARFLRHALKMKGLGWLPTLDTFRTFAVQLAL